MPDVLIRRLTTGEFDLFDSLPMPTSGVGARSRTFAELAADGQYREDWAWIALRGDTVVARAAFWGPPDAAQPYSVDFFDLVAGPDGVEAAAELLRTAYQETVPGDYHVPTGNDRPDYHLFLPADWCEHPDAVADCEDRAAAAEKAGLRLFVERINVRWTLADGLPPRSTRLRFGPATDDDLVARVLADLCQDSLDGYARRDVERYGLRRAAELTIEECAAMPGGRQWWRLGYDADGEVVGIVLPTAASSFATLAYVGVRPAHRGRHYSDDLVTEALHLVTEAGHDVVCDATDVGNAPMAATFERLGYRVTGRRLVFL